MRRANDIQQAPIRSPARMNILFMCIHVHRDHSLKEREIACIGTHKKASCFKAHIVGFILSHICDNFSFLQLVSLRYIFRFFSSFCNKMQ